MNSINRKKNAPHNGVSASFVVSSVLVMFLMAGAGIGYVHVKNQQHVLGERTRKIETGIRELHAYNQVLRSEINHLASHAQISSKVSEGMLALVPISDQFVARLVPPAVVAGAGDVLQTAMAGVPGGGSARP